MSRQAQLDRLIREQQYDRARHRERNPWRRRTRLRVNLDHLTAQPGESRWVVIEGTAWDMTEHALSALGQGPCPVCHDRELGETDYCLGCDHTGLDESDPAWPGLPVGYAMDPDTPSLAAPVYQVGRLDGGRGRRR